MNLFRFKIIKTAWLIVPLIFLNMETAMANIGLDNLLAKQNSQIIQGMSGGSIDSQGCGFISETPSYEMNLRQRIDYMRFTVQAVGGQPTLLVVGPNSGDSFCVLGDEILGLKPEISGVWEPGKYKIYVGDRTPSQHEYTLSISEDN